MLAPVQATCGPAYAAAVALGAPMVAAAPAAATIVPMILLVLFMAVPPGVSECGTHTCTGTPRTRNSPIGPSVGAEIRRRADGTGRKRQPSARRRGRRRQRCRRAPRAAART